MRKLWTSTLLVMLTIICTQALSQQKPNIIFILTDDQRFDALGYAGNELSYTPEMDKLAEDGSFFTTAMVSTPICAASRASIFTGLYERTHNFNFQTPSVRDEYMAQSYPMLLKEHGYETAFYGKYGIRYAKVTEQFDFYESYDRIDAYPDRSGYYYKTIGRDSLHLTRYTGQKALDYLEQTDELTKPFCLSLSFSAPHAHDPTEEQYFWQEKSDQLLQDITVPLADISEDAYFDSQPQIVRDGLNRLRWEWRYDTPEKYQQSVKGYHRMISGIDFEIAKIRAKLSEKGLAENTVIILMGDNGYFLGERQLAGKWLLYDNSIRVPLIIYDPRMTDQKDSDVIALNIDIPATILDLADIPQPDAWQGKSLLPISTNQSTNLNRDTVLIEHLWEFAVIPPSEGVRTKVWKYFRYVNDKSLEELYNLALDPQETNNLALDPRHEEKLLAFRLKTDQMIQKYSDQYTESPRELNVETEGPHKGRLNMTSRLTFNWNLANELITQSAYQILVASSLEDIEKNNGDVWNSQKIRSTETALNTKYTGQILEEQQNYFWKVRIWDEENRLGRYSSPQSFSLDSLRQSLSED